MNIELRRYRIKSDTIDGQIFIDGAKVCDCAENAHHCLPPGEYQIIVHKCRHHARKMPVICLEDNTREALVTGCTKGAAGLQSEGNTCLDGSTLPPCDQCPKLPFVGNNTTMPLYCPQLCPGNGVYNRTDGAILVGKNLAPGCLSHPKSAFDNLYDRIRKNAERGNEITLTITTL